MTIGVDLGDQHSHFHFGVSPTDGSSAATSQTGLGAFALQGQTTNYQYWFRDIADPCGGGFNLSNGYSQPWE